MSGPPVHSESVETERVLAVVREVTAELMGDRVTVGLDSDLERHLGLGSLERVELVTRLEASLGISLPDNALAEARTPRQLVAAAAEGAREGGRAVLTGESAGGAPSGNLAGAAAPQSERKTAAAVMESPPLSRTGLPATQIPREDSVRTVLEALRFQVERDGDSPHIRLLDDQLRPTTLSYENLWRRALSASGALAESGVRVGERVALVLPTGEDFFVGFMGILGAGAVPVPIYPPVRLDQIAPYLRRHAAILQNAGVRALFTDDTLRSVGGLLKDRVSSLEHVLTVASTAGSIGQQIASADDDALGLIQYTSGSTGEPKGVALRHRNLLANIRAIGKGLALGPEDVCVSWLPLYHDMGLIGSWLTALLHGVPIALMSPLQFLARPERWLWAIHRFRGTVSPAPNFGYELCCRKIQEHAVEGLDLSSWRVAMNGSEPVLAGTLERFCTRFGAHGFRRGTMLPVYGMAENCVALAFPPLGREPLFDEVDRQRLASDGLAVASTGGQDKTLRFAAVGKALEGHAIRIVPADEPGGAELAERSEGRILFRGPSAMAGYFERPDATEAVRVGDWIDSGDLGYVADGELYITGRAKDLVIKGGRKYHPQDIESAVASVEGIRKGCIVAFAAPDPQRGEAIVVVAETHRPTGELAPLAAQVTAAVLDAIGTPADHVVLVGPGTIPKTSSGKLRRRETRQRHLDGKLEQRSRPWLALAGVALKSFLVRLAAAARKSVHLAYGVGATAVAVLIVLLGATQILMSRSPGRAWAAAAGWLGLAFRAAGIPVRRQGQALAAGPVVLVSNHGSYLDALFLISQLERPVAILTREDVFHWPVLGRIVQRLEAVPVERTAGRAPLEAFEKAREALRSGRPLLVFPEGTFGRSDGVRPFRLGAFQVAAEERVPVQPIGLRGHRQVFREGSRLLHAGSVTIDVLPAMDPAPKGELRAIAAQREAAREAIAAACGEPLLQITSVAVVRAGQERALDSIPPGDVDPDSTGSTPAG